MDAARQALLDALAAHEPADADERRDRDAIAALVAATPRCFDRDLYEPGPPHRQRVRGRRAERQACCCTTTAASTAGCSSAATTTASTTRSQTALREAREESGLTDLAPLSAAILDVDVHAIPAARGEPPHLHHDVRYALVTRTPDLIAQAAESLALRGSRSTRRRG